MRLFSEKVTPTFTYSNQNILTVKDYSEVFFDVFELEINGNKYIAEKVSEYKGSPVVNIPIVIDGKELEAPFVIQRGNFEVIFNEINSAFIRPATDKLEEIFIEEKSEEEEVEAIIFEKKESILQEIKQARRLASEFVKSIKQQNIRDIKESNFREREIFFKSKEKFKTDLLQEFLQLSNSTRNDLFEYTEQESVKAYNFIIESVNSLSDKLAQDLESTIQEQNTQSIKLFENRISELAKNILTNNLLKEIEKRDTINNKNLNIKFDTVSKSLTKVLSDWEVNVTESVRGVVSKLDSSILTLEQANIELSDSITRSSNKALSRIGNVKTRLEDSLTSVSSELVNKITLAESRIKDYYNDRIALIETSVVDSTTREKAHLIELIKESKQSILDEVAAIKNSIPSVVVEKTLETKGDVDIKSIKTDLEKSISNRFTQELANVRRIIELSSGGGSVAVQFANGGTMRGNLNVIGDISATGVIYNNNFNSNNWNDTYTSVQANSANWNDTYTNLVSNSAAYLSAVDLSFLSVSANWNDTYTSVQANSANWNDTYTNLVSNSAAYLSAVDLSFLSVSANWNDTYTSVQANSANWSNAYDISTNYQAVSSTFATVEYTYNNFFHLSGGTISGDTKVKFGDLTVYGNISATGSINYSNTFISTTSSLCALANSPYPVPGLYVSQAGTGDIASFYDVSSEREILHIGGSEGYPGVGVNTSLPNKDFTVIGDISATGIIYNNDGFDSNAWNNTYTYVKQNSGYFVTYDGSGVNIAPRGAIIGSTYGCNQLDVTSYTMGIKGLLYGINVQTSSDLVNLHNWYFNPNGTFTFPDNTVQSTAFTGIPLYITDAVSTLNSTSANWDSAYTSVQANSANWNSAYTNLVSNSAAYLSAVDLSFLSVSANWNDTYTNLVSNSAAYLSAVDLSFLSVSANWNDTYTNLVSNSAAYLSAVDLSFLSVSANWNDTYTNLVSNSAAYLSAVDLSFLSVSSNWDNAYTSVSNTSANWDNAYNTVQANSATTWNYQGYDLKALSAGWDSSYTTVNANSANWDNAYNTGTTYQSNSASYSTIEFVNSKFLPLSGGIITGETRINNNLTVFGNLTATGTTTFANTVFSVTSALSVIHVGSGSALWVGNNGTGDIASFYDIDQNVEILHVGGINSANPNVGIKTSTPNKTFTVVGEISSTSDITTSGKIYVESSGNSDQWSSTYTTVNANSATNWNYQGNDLKALSADWVGGNSAYASANALSANSSSVYTTVNSTSANWDNAYASANALSANSSSVYTTVNSTSANWDNAYASANALSANSSSVYTTVNSTSANWDNAYTTFSTVSSNYAVVNSNNNFTSSQTINGSISASGNLSAVNINTSGDIEFSDLTKGVILRSPDSSRWRITINNNGALTTTKL